MLFKTPRQTISWWLIGFNSSAKPNQLAVAAWSPELSRILRLNVSSREKDGQQILVSTKKGQQGMVTSTPHIHLLWCSTFFMLKITAIKFGCSKTLWKKIKYLFFGNPPNLTKWGWGERKEKKRNLTLSLSCLKVSTGFSTSRG